MKKLLLILPGMLCILSACHTDTTTATSSASDADVKSQITDDWQKIADEISGSIKQQYLDKCKSDMEQGTKSSTFDGLIKLIDPENADQVTLFSFPIYTIDTTLWTTQPDLSFDAYLRLRADWIGFYLSYQGELNTMIVAKYNEDSDNPWHVGTVVKPIDDQYLQEASRVAQAMATGDPIIGLSFPKNPGTFVYIKQNGKWIRVSGGLMNDSDDVVKDLRNTAPYNRWIMRK